MKLVCVMDGNIVKLNDNNLQTVPQCKHFKVPASSACYLCLLQGSGGPGFSSTKGITIFSAMSVSRENVGYTMKSMKPAITEILTCASQMSEQKNK